MMKTDINEKQHLLIVIIIFHDNRKNHDNQNNNNNNKITLMVNFKICFTALEHFQNFKATRLSPPNVTVNNENICAM